MSYLFVSCNKTPEERLFWLTAHGATQRRMSGEHGVETADHVVSILGKQKAVDVDAQFSFSFSLFYSFQAFSIENNVTHN